MRVRGGLSPTLHAPLSAPSIDHLLADHLEAFRTHGTERVLIAYDRDEAGDRAALKLAEKLAAENITSYRVLFPRGMDANEYALKLTPAEKSLGLALRKAEWMGKGKAPPVTLGLPAPTRFAVPANTLVAADTYGFHARGDSDKPTKRVEIWAYSRRAPFLPWAGGGLMSWKPIADRRARWLNRLGDWADRRGLAKQHWLPEGLRRPIDS